MSRKKYMVGNWKMNQVTSEIKDFFSNFDASKYNCSAWVAPQFIHIPLVQELGGNSLGVGSQNCSHQESGAFTGDISPKSLKDINAGFTLIGHSERRAIFKEANELLNEKTKLALECGLEVIFCVGETLEEREQGKTEAVVESQLAEGLKGINSDKIIIAYEPVWAIGTGKTATPLQAEEVHKFIRNYLSSKMNYNSDDLSILYGGSVKPSNVAELLSQSNIDGGLVGGASLKASDFTALCEAAST